MVEQSTVNRLVPGSSPGSPANNKARHESAGFYFSFIRKSGLTLIDFEPAITLQKNLNLGYNN